MLDIRIGTKMLYEGQIFRISFPEELILRKQIRNYPNFVLITRSDGSLVILRHEPSDMF